MTFQDVVGVVAAADTEVDVVAVDTEVVMEVVAVEASSSSSTKESTK